MFVAFIQLDSYSIVIESVPIERGDSRYYCLPLSQNQLMFCYIAKSITTAIIIYSEILSSSPKEGAKQLYIYNQWKYMILIHYTSNDHQHHPFHLVGVVLPESSNFVAAAAASSTPKARGQHKVVTCK